MAPDVREKSGVWYGLNRWPEEQITGGKHPTYGDLSTEADTTYEDVPDATYCCAQEPKGMPASSAGSLERDASVGQCTTSPLTTSSTGSRCGMSSARTVSMASASV
jgi:hypothetical protein